ncbi:flagellar basal body rod protein FlgF [Proteus mirabilis]|uniref:flagellar basal body rod protein FlgF n=1 Tax=Proteus mirabilis TaxID=584 RepID=UPI001F04DF0A|nr:flagellar basal body rod protein FlgF [Proteus mirabilis]EKU2369507.1 flagellar basal body rod protein FlgF [Proteus mirabilis]EKU7917561.1 flagellar basal body rod protein FlgF [Proteus mirabilis]EKU7921671.1 flagellar basal body rod protein FlgF [Proteus mirabilis]EKU8689860.1 flagellar basal body rod protein FlgF [Proteus mirabilis]EKU8701827.1 flagellar basal body rod protein FlgF [Proteus mirabilis]
MDHVIYTAMGGARHSMENQAVVANNLANASTPGFKAQLSAMRAVPINGETLLTRTLTVESTPGSDQRQGTMNYTGRPMDVALSDNGYLAVQLEDGTQAYTRNGNIERNADGMLMVQGRLLMGDNGAIEVPPQAEISIANNGIVTAHVPTDPPKMLGQIGRLKMVKPEQNDLVRGDDGLFHLSPQGTARVGETLPADDNVKVLAGVLEGSNVNPAEAMVDMIANARRFEMQMKVIHSADDNAQRANQLLSMS